MHVVRSGNGDTEGDGHDKVGNPHPALDLLTVHHPHKTVFQPVESQLRQVTSEVVRKPVVTFLGDFARAQEQRVIFAHSDAPLGHLLSLELARARIDVSSRVQVAFHFELHARLFFGPDDCRSHGDCAELHALLLLCGDSSLALIGVELLARDAVGEANFFFC